MKPGSNGSLGRRIVIGLSSGRTSTRFVGRAESVFIAPGWNAETRYWTFASLSKRNAPFMSCFSSPLVSSFWRTSAPAWK